MRNIFRLVSYGSAFIHMLFVKIMHPNKFYASLIQDISASSDVIPAGVIRLGKRIHAKKNTVFESMRGGVLEIGDDSFFNNNCMVVANEKITIGRSCSCGPNVMIYDHDHKHDSLSGFIHESYVSKPVKIGDRVWIGANTVILAGTELGDRCVVGAGSVLKGKYPAGSVIIQRRVTECKNPC